MGHLSSVVLALALSIVGCNDKSASDSDLVSSLDSDASDTDSGGEGPGTTGDDTAPPAEDEICDGIDNDLDGAIDEDLGDADGDGVSDCSDESCVAAWDALAFDYDVAPACYEPFPADEPWDIELIWEVWLDDNLCRVTAIVDINNDGYSDIFCSSEAHNEWLTVLSGVDGSELWTSSEIIDGSPIVVLDIDGDGTLEVLGMDEDPKNSGGVSLVSLSTAGEVEWRRGYEIEGDIDIGPSASYIPDTSNDISFYPTDLERDGKIEILTEWGILSSDGGELLHRYDDQVALRNWPSDMATGDLNLDGEQEIYYDWQVFDADGELLWWVEMPDESWHDGVHAMLVQADGDDEGEVLWMGGPGFLVTDTDGTLLYHNQNLGSDSESFPMKSCAGDLDGDGQVEVMFADGDLRAADGAYTSPTFFAAVELDGTPLWERPMAVEDLTHFYAACSVFDFDLDGAMDVIVGDESALYILDGPTGEARFTYEDWEANFYQMGWPVDIDGDGSVEIVAVPEARDFYSDVAQLQVFGHASREWPPGTTHIPHEFWSGVGLWPDGTPTGEPERPWLETGLYRGQPTWQLSGRDLGVEVQDSCVSSCVAGVGTVTLGVRLFNLGPQVADAGTPLAIYLADEHGRYSLDRVHTMTDALQPQTIDGALTLDLSLEQATRGVRLVAGDSGDGRLPRHDCDLENNTLDWALKDCAP